MPISRRSFLKGSAATATISMIGSSAIDILGASNVPLSKGPGNKWEGRVVVNYNKNATKGNIVDEAAVKKMVDDSILFLSGEESIGAAWKSIFPSTLTAASKIAIKINIANTGNPCPHPFSVMAITEGLQMMDFDGTKIPASNITLYEMNNNNLMNEAGYTEARFPGISLVKDSASVFGDGAMNNRAYATTLNKSDFLINVFSPRGHSTKAIGTFTLGFKSHYGTYANVIQFHTSGGAEALRDFNCTGPVYKKSVLSICSGIFGMNESNGPTGGADNFSTYSKTVDASSTNVNPTTIIMSTDPVSCEMQTIKMMRINKGKSYAIADLPNFLRASAGITGALSDATYNIGIIDESQMDVRKIINGERIGTPVKSEFNTCSVNQSTISATQLRNQHTCFIEYSVPVSYVSQKADISIVNLEGRSIRNFSSRIQGAVNNFSWDLRDVYYNHIPAGTYVIALRSGSLKISSRFTVVN